MGQNGYFVFTLDAENRSILAHARMFAPAIGIAEDPVTGNGNGPLGAYLLRHGLAKAAGGRFEFRARQGEAMGRPGEARVIVGLDGGEPVPGAGGGAGGSGVPSGDRIVREADRPAVWWTLLALACLAILAAVPVAFELQVIVRDLVGPRGLRLILIAAVLALALAAVRALRRRGTLHRGRLLGTLAIVAAVAIWMWRMSVVAEGIHLVQYGLLSVLALRALACHRHDGGAYLAALAFAAGVGALEEFAQWLAPRRYWDLHEIGLNAAGAAFGLLLVWTGVRPERLAPPPRPGTLRLALGLAALGLAVAAVPWLLGSDAV